MTPETHTEKIGLAVWLVVQGPISSCALAAKLDMTPDAALRLLLALSRVVPLRYDRARRVWRLCETQNADGAF